MLEANKEHFPPPGELGAAPADESSGSDALTLAIGVARRQILVLVVFAIVGSGLGAAFLIRAQPNFTATATLLIDTRKIEILQQPAVSAQMPIESSGAMESQVEILKSEQIALSVINKLRLSEDPRFLGTEGGGLRAALFGKIFALFTPVHPTPTNIDGQELARAIFERNLTANRIGNTYAIEIGFESKYADIAARIANAVADTYIEQELASQNNAIRQASDWLGGQVRELRDQSAAAQQAVVEYKSQNKIVETGTGELIDDQRLVELNGQLEAAHSKAAEAKARFDQLDSVTRADSSDSIVNATIGADGKNDVLSKLRMQYLELESREAEWSAKYGHDHLAVVNLRNQMLQVRSGILDQFNQLKESSRNDFELAEQREAGIKKELAEAVALSKSANEAEVTLRQLEASARTYKELYDTLLNRYAASLQQQTSPAAEASVITRASTPTARNYKTTLEIAAIFALAGTAVGVGIALWREFLARGVFRTGRSVEASLRMACIAVLPKIANANFSRSTESTSGAALGVRSLVVSEGCVGWAVDDRSFSRFTEGVRSIKMAVDSRNAARSKTAIGFTSAIPHEGKSTIAIAFGKLVARGGARVIVVDCDLRNPSLTRSMAPHATRGVLELISGEASLEEVVWRDQSTQMEFLPAVLKSERLDLYAILASDGLKSVFEKLRARYEYVVVDLSPLAPVIDVCATTQLIGSYVLVIEWGRTKIDIVEHALRAAPDVYDSMLGAVLNMTDMKQLAKYDPRLAGYYHNDRYQQYGYSDA